MTDGQLDWTAIGAILVGFGMLGTLFIWTINAIVAPLKVYIEALTETMNDHKATMRDAQGELKEHGELLADHGARISSLEKEA